MISPVKVQETSSRLPNRGATVRKRSDAPVSRHNAEGTLGRISDAQLGLSRDREGAVFRSTDDVPRKRLLTRAPQFAALSLLLVGSGSNLPAQELSFNRDVRPI